MNFTVTANTHKPDGRPVNMRRSIAASGPEEAARAALRSRKDTGHWFMGENAYVEDSRGTRYAFYYNPDTENLEIPYESA